MDELLKKLADKDDKAAYEFTKKIAAESASSNKYLDKIGLFASLLQNDSSYIRTRAFILICSQSRWADKGQIDSVFDQMSLLLNDSKPSVVRQCLKALQEVVAFRPEMSNRIEKAISKIDISIYKDSMSPLIKKDINELYRMIDEQIINTCEKTNYSHK